MIFQACRRFSSRRPIPNTGHYVLPAPQHSIYISNSTNPYFNLTIEDWSVKRIVSSFPILTSLLQALQTQSAGRTVTSHLPGRSLRRYWAKSEPMEGGQLPGIAWKARRSVY